MGAGAGLGVVAAGATAPATGAAQATPPTPGARDLRSLVKVLGRPDGVATFHHERGALYGLRPGESARLLLAFEGCAVRRFAVRSDGGYDLTVQHWLLFQDPATGMIADEWINPYTLETVAPAHVCDVEPPLRLMPLSGLWSAKWTVGDELAVCEFEVVAPPSADPAGLPGDVHAWMRVGLHQRTITTSRPALDEPGLIAAPAIETWTRTTEWPAFLNMSSWAGQALWRASSRKIDRLDGLDPVLRREIGARWPGDPEAAASRLQAPFRT